MNVDVFDITIQKTNALLKEIESSFLWADRKKSYLALRAVLHVLRDRLPIEHVVGLGAQLPMLVRGFYYEGWKPASAPKKMIAEEFIGEVERLLNPPFEEHTEEIIKTVIAALREHIDPKEIEKIQLALPKEIREIINK